VRQGRGGVSDDNVDAPAASCWSNCARIDSSGTLVDINATSNAINSSFLHEARNTAVAIVLSPHGRSGVTIEAVDNTPVVGICAETEWVIRDDAVEASFIVDADAVVSTAIDGRNSSRICESIAGELIETFIDVDELPDSIIGKCGHVLGPSWLSSANNGISVVKSDVS